MRKVRTSSCHLLAEIRAIHGTWYTSIALRFLLYKFQNLKRYHMNFSYFSRISWRSRKGSANIYVDFYSFQMELKSSKDWQFSQFKRMALTQMTVTPMTSTWLVFKKIWAEKLLILIQNNNCHSPNTVITINLWKGKFLMVKSTLIFPFQIFQASNTCRKCSMYNIHTGSFKNRWR